ASQGSAQPQQSGDLAKIPRVDLHLVPRLLLSLRLPCTRGLTSTTCRGDLFRIRGTMPRKNHQSALRPRPTQFWCSRCETTCYSLLRYPALTYLARLRSL